MKNWSTISEASCFALSPPSSMEKFVPEPSSFKISLLHLSNDMITPGLQYEIKQGMDWDKPAVHFAQSFHENLEPRIYFSIFKKSCREMRIHNASAAFPHQSVLVFLADDCIKRFDSRPF